jgi:hypothetical protein
MGGPAFGSPLEESDAVSIPITGIPLDRRIYFRDGNVSPRPRVIPHYEDILPGMIFL